MVVTRISWLKAELCGLCPPFEIIQTDQNKWISTHYPRKAVKKPQQEQSAISKYCADIDYVTAVVSRLSENRPEYFLVQRPETGLLAGLWDFPNIVLEDPEIEESSVEEILLDYLSSLGLTELGAPVKKGSSLHIFTHIRRTSLVYTVQVAKAELPESQVELQGKWVTEEEITDMAVSELGRKVLRLALGVEKAETSR